MSTSQNTRTILFLESFLLSSIDDTIASLVKSISELQALVSQFSAVEALQNVHNTVEYKEFLEACSSDLATHHQMFGRLLQENQNFLKVHQQAPVHQKHHTPLAKQVSNQQVPVQQMLRVQEVPSNSLQTVPVKRTPQQTPQVIHTQPAQLSNAHQPSPSPLQQASNDFQTASEHRLPPEQQNRPVYQTPFVQLAPTTHQVFDRVPDSSQSASKSNTSSFSNSRKPADEQKTSSNKRKQLDTEEYDGSNNINNGGSRKRMRENVDDSNSHSDSIHSNRSTRRTTRIHYAFSSDDESDDDSQTAITNAAGRRLLEYRKGPWDADEDKALVRGIKKYGTDDCNKLVQFVPTRTAKQIRDHMRPERNPTIQPDIKRALKEWNRSKGNGDQ